MTRSNLSRSSAFALILLTATTALAQDRPIVGAIRWDAWQEGGNVLAQVETTLGNPAYHERIPWFGTVNPDNSVDLNGNTQAIMDQEIAYAADAGLDYWAFVTYPEAYGMSNGLGLYLSSSQKSRMNFCLDIEGSRYAGDTSYYENRLLTSFADPDYQKVMGDRPLVYIFDHGGNLANANYSFDALRTASINNGTGDPYIVIQGFNSSSDKQHMDVVGADAIGRYAAPGGSYPTGTPFASAAAQDVTLWNQAAGTGADVVPLVSTGWDRRPRYDAGGVTWEGGPGNPDYFESPTPAELTDHLLDGMDWVRSNPSAAPANALLMYAWNEHDEGGWISPTRDLDGSPNTERIDAIAAALNAPLSVPVSNGSFETVGNSASGNVWYELPASTQPGYAWVDGNPGAAIYEILDLAYENDHFPGTNDAPDGTRVMNLGAASPMTQDLAYAIQAGDTITLSFYLGNSDAQSDPPGDVQATLTLDGVDAFGQLVDNDAGDGAFAKKTLVWVADADGVLGLKFVAVGSTWLDAISVNVYPVPEPTSAALMSLAGLLLLRRRRRSCRSGAAQ